MLRVVSLGGLSYQGPKQDRSTTHEVSKRCDGDLPGDGVPLHRGNRADGFGQRLILFMPGRSVRKSAAMQRSGNGSAHRVFHGCKDSLGKECKTGAEAEVVRSKALSGELVDLESGEKRVGELLRPATGTQFISEMKCSVTVTVTGEVMGEILPENSYRSELELAFKIVSATQKWRQIEEAGSFHELIVAGGKAALESVQVLTFSKPLGVMS
jgi:hypothetical protein